MGEGAAGGAGGGAVVGDMPETNFGAGGIPNFASRILSDAVGGGICPIGW